MNKKLNKIIFAILMCVAGAFGFISCDGDDNPKVKANVKYKDSGLYLGITGFNGDLYHYSDDRRYFSLLTSSSASEFKSFVNGLNIDISTVLYYAVDNAVTILEKASFPDDLSKVALVTFTDGLDEGSFAYDSKYSDVTAVSEHLKSARVDGKQIEAYAIGLRGNDVVDAAKFRSDLIALASSTSNAMEVSNMSEVDAKFQQLASSLYSESSSQSMSLTVPLKPSGVKTRFTFDGGLTNGGTSSCYIEGTWDDNGKLTKVTYVGLKCSSGNVVSSSKVADNKTLRTFTFTDISKTEGSDVSKDKVQVWNKNTGSSVWTPNSEFDPSKNSQTIVEQKSAVIMLVLDCSSSLGNSGLNQIKQTVKNFIDVLYKNSSANDSNTGNGGSSSSVSGTENGYDYVDLGLSVKWATCNVGATKPEEYGNYYAWGETTPKTTYNWSTNKWCNGSYDTMTKYCTDSDYGTVDNKTVLDKEDDAAAVNMGGDWRMPTSSEQDELRAECTWTWTTLNDVNGYNVEGPNGNSIFFPAAGYRYSSDLSRAGSYGSYWSSSLNTGLSYNAYGLDFSSDNVHWNNDGRYYGQSVRGVFSK